MSDDLFNELANQEQEFLNSEFFAPRMRRQPIRVKIAGVVMTLKVRGNFEGWGVFKPTSEKTCELVREASLEERQRYLELFPSVRVILCVRRENRWYGHPGNSHDPRFKFEGLIPVILPVEPQMFDTAITRFDGKNFWYESVDAVHDPRVSEAMRQRLVDLGEPKNFRISGMTAEEREAYTVAYAFELENRKDLQEERVKIALQRAGAQYRSYIERGSSLTVEYVVEGQNYRSTVNKDTLSVESAGICLTDHRTGRVGDSDFDLQSLVGVIREGQETHQIHRW